MTYSLRGTTSLLSLAVTVCLFTSGCQMQRPERVDGKLVLNGLPSPDVKGVGDTMKQSAMDAEQKGDYRHANQLYRQLADKEPDNLDIKMRFADTARRAEFYKPAIDTYNEILAKEPDRLEALEGKGLAMLGKGDFDGAGDVLGQVIAKDKTRWRALNAMGILFVGKGMYQEAMSYYTEALTQSPNNVRILNNVGLTLAIKKELPDAIESLSMASGLVPNDQPRLKEQIDLNLALVYGIAGDIDHAENIASRHLSGAALDNNLGLYAHLANDDVMAKSYLNMALSSSSHFYNRAWQNLEAINTRGSNGEEVTTSAKSYKVNALTTPPPAHTPPANASKSTMQTAEKTITKPNQKMDEARTPPTSQALAPEKKPVATNGKTPAPTAEKPTLESPPFSTSGAVDPLPTTPTDTSASTLLPPEPHITSEIEFQP
jgi:Flp pilus assembly protein TadD